MDVVVEAVINKEFLFLDSKRVKVIIKWLTA
jgi:hypothetical protein